MSIPIIFLRSIIVIMIPSTPNGYATAYPSPISGTAAPSIPEVTCERAFCAAPSPGVFVTAPDITPTSSGTGVPEIR